MLKIEDVVDSQRTVYIAGAISDDKIINRSFARQKNI